MAIFKIGQRVRIVGFPRNAKSLCNIGAVGREAVVVAAQPDSRMHPKSDYGIHIPGWPYTPEDSHGDWWGIRREDIVPLTNPGADTFVAEAEKFARKSKSKHKLVPA